MGSTTPSGSGPAAEGFRTAPAEIGPGSELGSWRLVSLLGEGAMGRVWRAEHVRLGRASAIKVLNPEYVARPDVVQRFFREARVVNDVDHEHIVEVTDFVESPGLAYLVMELLEGESLRAIMKRRGRRWPPIRRIVAIMAQICDALEAAHAKGVVHRDLKPDNVFVVSRRGDDFVKVLDFGVAKLRDAVDGAATATGMILGTPLYMAPEQAGGREVDARADVWAAGVVLYELLSGAVPFRADGFVELVAKLREQAPPPLPPRTPRRERIPPELAAAAMKCLEKRPGDRFRSMAALAEALRAVGGARAAGRSRRLLGVAALAALLAAGAAAAVSAGVPGRVVAAFAGAWRGLVARMSMERPPSPVTPQPQPPASGPAARVERETAPSAPQGVRGEHGGPGGHAARPAAPAPAVPSVELSLRSTPAGALIERLDTGQRLGKTPSRVKVARKASVVWIRLSLDGYEPVKFAVSLKKDGAANVTLHRAARKGARR